MNVRASRNQRNCENRSLLTRNQKPYSLNYERLFKSVLLYISKWLRTIAVPLATQRIGSSAMYADTPSDLLKNSSKSRSCALPPDIMIPFSIMSAASSGGVSSKTAFKHIEREQEIPLVRRNAVEKALSNFEKLNF